jgi:acyl-CoA synthetase (AMP-forming)/AMP-acid ligase II
MSITVRRLPDALKVRAQNNPNGLAHDDTRRKLTFAEWDREADEIGGGLAAAGVKPGDRVFLPINNDNAVEMAIAVFAAMRAGAIACPVNARLTATEMQEYAALLEPTACITNVPDKVQGVNVGKVFLASDMPRDILALPDQASLDPNADAEILQTSGTTGGKLKGVVISHPDLLGQADGVTVDKSNGTMAALPFTGSGGNLGILTLPVRNGSTGWTMPKFDPAKFMAWAQEVKPDTIYLVPSMLRLILDLPNVADYDISSTKWMMTGTAPLPHDSVVRAMDLWPNVRLRNSYGMSEGGIGVSTRTKEAVLKPGCVGRMGPNMELRDEAGNKITELNVVGEIFGKQANPRRYWRDDAATKSSFVGGWTKTGDLGYMDHDGDLIISGRSKELIIRGGYNIAPIEIEDVLHEHPAVKDAAVLGIDHEVLGEDIAAAVTLLQGKSATVEELQAWCKEKLADNKVPRTIVILPELPLNANGKFLKRELKPVLQEAAAARKAKASA